MLHLTNDNPMLAHLQAEYSANLHFASLADDIAKELIGCSFREGMNAYPDASLNEAQWLGAMKRLVCNAIFRTYSGPPVRPFDAALFCRAQQEIEGYASKIQGFRYKHPESGGYVHIVRNLPPLPNEQDVWRMVEDRAICEQSEEAAKAEYDRCHSAMMLEIQRRQIQMAWDHYTWGITSGAFDKEEES